MEVKLRHQHKRGQVRIHKIICNREKKSPQAELPNRVAIHYAEMHSCSEGE